MVNDLIQHVRRSIEQGEYTKAGLARAAGLHPNTLRDADKEDWSPNASTLIALEQLLFPPAQVAAA